MGVSSGRGGDVIHRDPSHWSIHKEAEGNHSVEGGLLAFIGTVQVGGENSGDETDGALVISRHGKITGGINKEED